MMEMRIGRVLSAAAAMAGLTLALASGASARGLVAPVTAGPPRILTVKHLELDGFFPTVTKIHVGDSVSWTINGFHTVSILGAGAPPPLIVPAPANPITGRLDATGAAMWFNGKPNQVINPIVAAPSGGRTYAGKGFLNSGLPAGNGAPPPFVVRFTKAGSFTFHCLVHPGMQGVVRVLPKSRQVPSAIEDRAAGALQAAAAVRQARTLAKVKPAAATVLAGNDGAGPVAWLRFFPEKLRVKAGTTVDFRLSSRREVHTITIGPAAYTSEIEKTFTTPVPNPAGPPTLLVNPFGAYPSDPPPLPAFTGANHGNGFEASGILAAPGGPLPSDAKITFTKPGVYAFECVIHPNMDGTITVTK
jgi:plastocyanin